MSFALLDRDHLSDVCLASGADDVRFVDLDAPDLAGQRDGVRKAMPWAGSVMLFARRINRHTVRAPLRSLSSAEFNESAHEIKAIAHRIVGRLENDGIRSVGFSGLFPMEFGRPDGLPFILQLKYLAEAGGLGVMGRNRMVLHPRFGPYMYLGAVILDGVVGSYDRPLTETPCLGCNLCAVACPTGAVSRDGHFDFGSCSSHNYREKGAGFVEWVHTLADARDRDHYRAMVSDAETLSWWQSLGYDANTHCDYCVAVCPAGAEAAAFLADRKKHYAEIVAPLRERVEKVYVVAGSDAEHHVVERFPHKSARRVNSGRAPSSIGQFAAMMPVLFQRGRAGDLAARYHFRFRSPGQDEVELTVTIGNGAIAVGRGLSGSPDLSVTADGGAWLDILARRRSPRRAMLTGRLRWHGPRRLLDAFLRCFPF